MAVDRKRERKGKKQMENGASGRRKSEKLRNRYARYDRHLESWHMLTTLFLFSWFILWNSNDKTQSFTLLFVFLTWCKYYFSCEIIVI